MPAPKTLKRVYSAVKYAALMAIALALLWASFRGVDFEEFKEGLKSADFFWIGVSMAVSILVFWLRALRWRLVMIPLGHKIKRVDAWDGINVGYITNFAIPRAGEFARCGVITRKTGLPFETVAGTVVLERGVDLLSLALLTLSVVVFQWKKFGSFIEREIITGIGEGFNMGFVWIALSAIAAASIFLYIVYRFRKSNALFAKLSNIAKGVIKGVFSGFKMPQKWMFLVYTVAIWGCYWLMSYSTILAFPAVAGLTIQDALFLMIIGGFGWVIPVQGGIGAYHFIISLALSSIYSINQTTGVVFATISHESQALTMLICGGISLISLSLYKRRR